MTSLLLKLIDKIFIASIFSKNVTSCLTPGNIYEIPRTDVQHKNVVLLHHQRLPFVWKTQKFRGEFKWNGS